MVVPVLMTSCQVSENLKNGPEIAQIMTIKAAPIKAGELPVNVVAQLANFSKRDCFRLAIFAGYWERKKSFLFCWE